MKRRDYITITVVLTVLIAAPVCAFFMAGDMHQEPQIAQAIIINDKPAPVDLGIEASEEAEEEYVEEVYYAPTYYNYHDSDYDDMSARDYIAQRESGQNYEARNGQYYGKYQLQEDMLAGDYSPENQEYMAEQYMLDRYGSWEAARDFWDSHGWW